MNYTLGMAARATGLSKTTIHRAVKNGRLPAVRTDAWNFSIDADELHRVFPPAQDKAQPGNSCVAQDATPPAQTEVALRYERLAAEIDAALQVTRLLREQLDETRVDRDRWRGQAQQLVAALPDLRPRRTSFAARLMGFQGPNPR
jgi:excisionase family DNA binding protein